MVEISGDKRGADSCRLRYDPVTVVQRIRQCIRGCEPSGADQCVGPLIDR